MTTMTHVLVGAGLTQVCGAVVGPVLAVASHPVLDAACRYHPNDLHWPWMAFAATGRCESRVLWFINAAAVFAALIALIAGAVSPYALFVGGLACGWLLPDVFHLFPYRQNWPHRLADWLRAKYWPRPVDEPWGAWAEAGLIVVLALVVLS